MNLYDLPPGLEDPVELLLGFHRRIERQLASLCRLPVRIEVNGIDAQAIASAASILDFFTYALPQHHADEEEDLLPTLERRLGVDVERRDFREMRVRLRADHDEIDATWRRVRRPLEAIGEGIRRELPVELARYFRTLHSIHICAEEGAVHLLAARRLLPDDHALLARRMAARRAVTRSSRG